MRSGPGVTFDDIVDIPAGATGLKIGQCMAPQDSGASHKDWCIVSWNGHQGFTSSCCIAPETAVAPASPAAPANREPSGTSEGVGIEVGESDGLAFQCDPTFKNCSFLKLVPNSGDDNIASGPGRGEVTWTQYTPSGPVELRCSITGESGRVGSTPYTCRVNTIGGKLFVMSDLQYSSGETLGVLSIDLKSLACGFATRTPAQHVETHYAMSCSPAMKATE
jgi:hypothetical protein